MSRSALIQELENEQLNDKIPHFFVGDTINVHLRIIEGSKERTQMISGTVIAKKGKGLSETFTIHRVAYGTGMERVFLLHSPKISKIEVTRRGKVRQAKLYYLRGTYGKKAKVAELMGQRRQRRETFAADSLNRLATAEELTTEKSNENKEEPLLVEEVAAAPEVAPEAAAPEAAPEAKAEEKSSENEEN